MTAGAKKGRDPMSHCLLCRELAAPISPATRARRLAEEKKKEEAKKNVVIVNEAHFSSFFKVFEVIITYL